MSWEHVLGWAFRVLWKAGKSTKTICTTVKRKQKTEKMDYLEPFQDIQASIRGGEAAASGLQ